MTTTSQQWFHGPPPSRRKVWPWVALGSAVAALVSAFVTAVVLAILWPTVPENPDPMQVAAFTQNAGTDLYGRGIWTDDGLLQVGLTVCETNGSLTEAQQIDRLQARWGGLDDYDVITLMHHANARLCPSS